MLISERYFGSKYLSSTFNSLRRLRHFPDHFFLLQLFQLRRDDATCFHKIFGIMRMTEDRDFWKREPVRLPSWTAVAVTPLSENQRLLRISKRRRAALAAALQDASVMCMIAKIGLCR
jgi:hypothetical protein